MGIGTRFAVGIPAAIVGGMILGPGGAYAAWKTTGFLVTGNPLYLIPGGGTLSDGVAVVTDGFTAASDLSDVASFAPEAVSATAGAHAEIIGHASGALADGAGPDILGNPSDMNIQQLRPMDIQGHVLGGLGNGELPKDIWGRV